MPDRCSTGLQSSSGAQNRATVIGNLLRGRYRLEERIGSGGMSTVYRAFDETLERWVAIKVLHHTMEDDPVQLERFRREARTVARLNHPHVVTVIDAGEDDGHPFIVFEYVDGDTLKGLIKRTGPLPVVEAVAYAIEIGRGLMAAHQERLVHRDVKPQNVLIDPDGRAKVTDFGISRSLDADGLTATGRVLGTTDYVAPEQALGEDVTEQSDVYSLGICLFEMLTGAVPFSAESQVGVAMKHVREPLPDVQSLRPEMSAALAAIVERSTSKERRNRYADAAEMVDDLEQALAIEAARAGATNGEATSVLRALPAGAADYAPRRLRNGPRPLWLGVATMLLAATGVAAFLLLRHTGADSSGQAKAPVAPAPLRPVRLLAAKDFDPPPGGDGAEHTEAVHNAIDGDKSTFWYTETYNGGVLPKPGVGLYVTADAPVLGRRLEVRSSTPGWSAEVYAAPTSPAGTLAGWGRPVAKLRGQAKESVALSTPAGQRFRSYLIWIDKLPPAGFVRINEVRLLR
ncbi:MAG: eukaryotic-like serine/threonine-protein kinase [Thermoleophilaceae bacterium]|nr:eukaryotic-like serine/threonine-protein kinase [Thermoleophilaceae bacterium]